MIPRLKITLITVSISLAFLGAVYLQFSTKVAEELTQLARRNEHQTQMLNESTKTALQTVEGLRAAAENNLTQAASLVSAYSRFFGEIPRKGGYGLVKLPSPSDPGLSLNLTGLGSLDGDVALQNELEAALLLEQMFRWVKGIYPDTPWVYYLSRRRFMCVYPYIPIDDFFMDDEFYKMDLFEQGTPENNPERNPYITDVYLDEAGKGLMVTVGAPVYQNDDFKGIVGFDLTLNALSKSLQGYQFAGDDLFLVNDKGEVIALAGDNSPPDTFSRKQSISEIRPGLLEIAKAHMNQRKTVFFENSRVFTSGLVGTPWLLITERSSWHIYRAAVLASLPLIAFLAVIVSGMAVYIRERQRQRQLDSERSLRRFRRLLDSTTDMIAVITPASGRFLDVNQTMCEFIGMSYEELSASRVYHLFTELASMEHWNSSLEKIRKNGRLTVEDSIRRPDGSCSVVELNAHYAKENGQEYIVAIVRDIAERKRTEIALREANQRFTSVLEGIEAWVYVADMETHELLYLNPRFKEKLGNVVGQKCWQTIYPDQKGPCGFCTNDKLLDSHGEPAGIYTWEHHDHVRDTWHYCTDRAIPWGDGRYVRLELAFEITERKQAEVERERLQRRLQQTQKMEAIGQLTGGVAHDFNNILVSVIGFAELAREEAGKNIRLRGYLDQIFKSGERARRLIGQLLVYSRGDSKKTVEPIPLISQLQEVLSMLRPMLSARIEIQTEWPESAPMVNMDPVHLQQLLMNLCINARDAMPAGGILKIAVKERSLEGEECRVCHEQISGDWVSIRVLDSGAGIDPGMLEKIFLPFYTTKQVGEGGGMGLAVVQGIVNTYGGHILVETRVGEGTQFDILLPPVSQTISEGEPAPRTRNALDLSGKRILVVDDDPVIRLYLEKVLASTDAEVTVCTGPSEALRVFRLSPDAFSLIITDQAMPEMSGVDLVREIRSSGEEIPVLMFSGYTEAVSERDVSELRIAELLMKPITVDELTKAVSHALAER